MAATASPSTSTITRRLFTVHEYYQMAEAGILNPDERVELIEGEILKKSPVGGPHINRINVINKLLVSMLGERVEVSPQNPLRLDDRSEPVPDITVLRERGDDDDVPQVSDVLVVIEVAVSSLRRDLGWKLALYARAGIPEVWVLDMNQWRLIRNADPSVGEFRRVEELRAGDSVSVPTIPDVSLAVTDLLGKRCKS